MAVDVEGDPDAGLTGRCQAPSDASATDVLIESGLRLVRSGLTLPALPLHIARQQVALDE